MCNISKNIASDSILINISPGSDQLPMQQEKNSALDPELINISTGPDQPPMQRESAGPSWWLLLIPIIGWIIYGAEKLMSSSTDDLQGRVSAKNAAKNLINALVRGSFSGLEACRKLGDKEYVAKNWRKSLHQDFKFGQEVLSHSKDNLAKLEEAIKNWAQKHEHPEEAVEFAQRGILTHLFTNPLLVESQVAPFEKFQQVIVNAGFDDNTIGKQAYKLTSVEFLQEETSILSTFTYNQDDQKEQFTVKFSFTRKLGGEFMFKVDRTDSSQ